MTSWYFIKDYFNHKRHYSVNQSMLFSSMMVSPVAIFFIYDRPITGFWYQAFLLGFLMCNNLYLYLDMVTSTVANKQHLGYGHSFGKPEKVYLKGTSKEEIEKIEFQDVLESFAEDFEYTNYNTMYENYWNNRISFFSMK